MTQLPLMCPYDREETMPARQSRRGGTYSSTGGHRHGKGRRVIQHEAPRRSERSASAWRRYWRLTRRYRLSALPVEGGELLVPVRCARGRCGDLHPPREPALTDTSLPSSAVHRNHIRPAAAPAARRKCRTAPRLPQRPCDVTSGQLDSVWSTHADDRG